MGPDKFRVLLLDEDLNSLEAYIERLQTSGYEVQTVTSGVAALDCIRSLSTSSQSEVCAFDAIIAEARKESGDGLQLLRDIQERYAPFQRPKFFFLTQGAEFSERELLRLGADAVFERPIRLEALMTYLENAALAKSRRQRVVAHLFVDVMAEFGREGVRKAMTLNLAPGGMCLVTGNAGFVPGTDIRFSINHGMNVLRGSGKIRWSNNIGQAHHTGVEFTADQNQSLRPFENLFSEIRSAEPY